MPLCSYCRKCTCQIIFSRNYNFTIADRASMVCTCPGTYLSLPFMSLGTSPPYFYSSTADYTTWSSRTVFCRMPLCSNFRMSGRQIIFSNDYSSVTAVWTTGSSYARVHLCLPLMSFGTFPPYFLVGIWGNFIWENILFKSLRADV